MDPRRRALALGLLAALPCANLVGQGVTTASIDGSVTSADSAGLVNATVTVTNTATGERWQAVTRSRGRYLVGYLSIGGPYSIEARAIGFKPAVANGILLSLGERHRADFVLAPTVVELPELTTNARHRGMSAGRTGPEQTFSGAEAAALPLSRRDFSQLVLLSPQAVTARDSGISIAGQPDRLNGFQVDGASNADLGGIHGISGFGTPGSTDRVRTLAIEAIKELQILVAPFDVRYGNFAGGLVNAVTRSGSNRWEGSLSSYVQNESITGRDSSGNRAADFSTNELTLTLGGPIVRDRAAIFVTAGLQRFVGETPASIGTDTTGGADSVGFGVRRADLVRFQGILRDTYRLEPGSIGSAPIRNPAGNLFAKVTLLPALNQRIELSHNYAEGTFRSGFGAFELSSHGAEEPATFNDSRLAWRISGLGRFANELTLARLAARQRCFPAALFPEIDVQVSPDPNIPLLSAGATNVCPERFANQTTWELTDNASWLMGAHHLTIGTHDETIRLHGSRRVRIPAGRWTFASLDSLQAGMPLQYVRDFAAGSQPEPPVSNYTVHQVGFYLQDQWTPLPSLTLTAGLRFDVPFLPRVPAQNPVLLSTMGVNTAVTPSGHVLWSPRLGFNYDAGRRGTTFLRGGVGLFSGRPMYLYFSNIFETTGLDWLRADCGPGETPSFTVDPALQPTGCQQDQPFVFEVNYFNPNFRFPRNLRVSLGGDVSLPWNMAATVDLLYIRGVNQFDITDVNLAAPTTASTGEGGRILYGSIDPDFGFAEPNRVNPAFNTVAELRNSSGDRTITVSGQIEKRFGNGTELSLAYTYTDARDRMSADCFNITCNLDFTALDGTLDERKLTTSSFGIEHKVTFAAITYLPLHFQVGLFYNGFSGRPYTYLVSGDANADGLQLIGLGNDIMYVPRDAADITLADPGEWAGLDSLIRDQRCLSSQRGRLMRRNSCRGHWATLLNARVSRPFALGHGQSLELIADVFNLLNLFDRDWGVQRTVASFQGDAEVLLLVGYDQANQRGIYQFFQPDLRVRDDGATRWRMQLGARYSF